METQSKRIWKLWINWRNEKNRKESTAWDQKEYFVFRTLFLLKLNETWIIIYQCCLVSYHLRQITHPHMFTQTMQMQMQTQMQIVINICRSNNMIFRVEVGPNRTVLCDWRFYFLCRSHHQSQWTADVKRVLFIQHVA